MRSIADPLDILVGAGTVRYLSELETAISAGAQFIGQRFQKKLSSVV